jgi:hypothetical protein
MAERTNYDRSTARRPPAASDRTPILVVPPQTREIIDERRRIREAFHDSKATTLQGRRRQR